MRFVVGLWSVDTPHLGFVRAELTQRIVDLSRAVDALEREVKKHKFPKGQRIHGIFVAPEYYLARKNAMRFEVGVGVVERTVDVGMRDSCLEMLMTVSEAYPHILIVPGTMTWKKTFDRLPQEQRKRDPVTRQRTDQLKSGPSRREKVTRELQTYINLDDQYDDLRNMEPGVLAQPASKFSTVLKGVSGNEKAVLYRPSNPAKLNMVAGLAQKEEPKFRTSSSMGVTFETPAGVAYYMRNTAYVLLGGRVIYKYHKRGDFYESVNTNTTVFVPSIKDPILDIDAGQHKTLKFGFEICLDHDNGTLRQLIHKDGHQEPDFHIVSSAHVMNEEQSMSMREGGYYLHASNVDGCTNVYRNVRGLMKKVPEKESVAIEGTNTPVRIWNISLERSRFLHDVEGALRTYGQTKSVLASKESKHAVSVLQALVRTEDLTSLREHIEWYVGKPQATQPHGAGGQLRVGKRLHKLLSPLVH